MFFFYKFQFFVRFNSIRQPARRRERTIVVWMLVDPTNCMDTRSIDIYQKTIFYEKREKGT